MTLEYWHLKFIPGEFYLLCCTPIEAYIVLKEDTNVLIQSLMVLNLRYVVLN